MQEVPALQEIQSALAKKIEFTDDLFEEDEKVDSLQIFINQFNQCSTIDDKFETFETIINKWTEELKNFQQFKPSASRGKSIMQLHERIQTEHWREHGKTYLLS